MSAFPFQFGRLCLGTRPDKRRSIVARYSKALAFWRECKTFDAALLLKLLHISIGGTHPGRTARSECDRTGRTSCDRCYPFAANRGKFGGRALLVGLANAAIFATGYESFAVSSQCRA